jgi:SARP family transcriptional regulator, regulator of embCAB operon
VRALHERILRQEPLDVKKAARTTATSGLVYPLRAAATRIGRLSDNDIVLDDANVSRHHAVIIDTGTSFVITDLRSANGVRVGEERIRGTATLADADRIRICDREFTFEIAPREHG